jgi:succinate dehydrogenase/fumarate reductase flavoprotein subunit
MSIALATETTRTIDELVADFIAAKAVETKANKDRIAIEEQIIAMLGKREEGSQTHELDNGMKVTITGKVTYSADMEKLQEICAKLPQEMRPIKTKIELDTYGAKYLRANEPAIWAKLAKAITVKAAKASIEVKA